MEKWQKISTLDVITKEPHFQFSMIIMAIGLEVTLKFHGNLLINTPNQLIMKQ